MLASDLSQKRFDGSTLAPLDSFKGTRALLCWDQKKQTAPANDGNATVGGLVHKMRPLLKSGNSRF